MKEKKITKPMTSFYRRVLITNLLLAVSWTASIALPTPAIRLEDGYVTGKVVDALTKEPLPGASVKIKGTVIGNATDLQGVYLITNAPTGKQTLVVTYIGYTEKEVEVDLIADDLILVNIELDAITTELEGITISGSIEGQTKALNQMKMSENIKNIVSADQIGRLPDLNTAEAIQRIPGASISRDQGEGRYVQVRGLPPNLTNISINGEQIPSPEGEFRFVALDVVPIDQLASIEITKTLTPDMDADAIGGSVNLITKTAKDDKPRFSGSVGGGYNQLMNDYTNYQAQLSYGQRFNKLGVSFNGSIFRNDRGSNNNEFIYGERDLGSGNQIVLTELQLRDYEVQRQRVGLSSTIDYKLNKSNEFYLKTIYNYYTDQEFRRRYRYRLNVTGGSPSVYLSPTQINNTRLENDLKDREQTQEIWSVNLGGKHTLSNLKFTLDYEVAYAKAGETELDRIDVSFRHSQRPNVQIDNTDPNFPQMNFTNTVDRFAYNLFNYNSIDLTDNTREDRNVTGKFNLKFPIKVGGNNGYIKTGFKYRDKVKTRNNDVSSYGNAFINPADAFTLASVLDDFTDTDFLGGKYAIGFFADPPLIRSFRDRVKTGSVINKNATRSLELSTLPFYDASEKVLAGYLMGNLQVNKLMMLGGLRWEKTDVSYTANEFNVTTTTVSRVPGENDYTYLLPNLQFKYEVDKSTNLRTAFTWSYARPNFEQIVPTRVINQQDLEITAGNPALKPTSSFNIDVLGEHFFKNVGILSGGVFYKRISDFNFNGLEIVAQGPDQGYTLNTTQNGDLATLWGVELNWEQNFTFLPGFLSGLGIFANYTYTNSDATIMRGDDPLALTEETITLPGQGDHIANIALSYVKNGIQVRLAGSYVGNFISELGNFKDFDVYSDKRFQLDLSASYNVNNNFSVFLEFNNLTNAPVRTYQGISSRPFFQEYYSWWTRLGVRFNFADF